MAASAPLRTLNIWTWWRGKILVTLPLGAWVLYRLFQREKAEASERGVPIVRTRVLVIAGGLLALAAGLLILSAQ